MSKRTIGAMMAVALLMIVAAIAVTVSVSTRGPATSAGPRQTQLTVPVAEEEQQPVATDDVATALSVVLDEKGGYENRVNAIRRLGRKLSAGQVASLRGLLRDRNTHATIRNEVLIVLVDQDLHRPTDLGADLIAMWKDASEDATWRDYCLQHVALIYEFDNDRAAIEAVLLDAAKGEDAAAAGTAMLSMARLGRNNPEFTRQASEVAASVVLASEADQEKAVTALQIARAAGDRSVLAKAREMAADTSVLVRLRMSAIGLIGELGEDSDVALLKPLCDDEEARVRRVATHNLEKLRGKLGR